MRMRYHHTLLYWTVLRRTAQKPIYGHNPNEIFYNNFFPCYSHDMYTNILDLLKFHSLENLSTFNFSLLSIKVTFPVLVDCCSVFLAVWVQLDECVRWCINVPVFHQLHKQPLFLQKIVNIHTSTITVH